jgi:hypothetical protein
MLPTVALDGVIVVVKEFSFDWDRFG